MLCIIILGSNISPLVIGWKSLTWFHVFSTISGCWSRFFTICGKDAIFSNSKNYTWFLILALFAINIQLSKNAQNSAAIRELKCRPRGTLAVPRLLRFSISDHWLVFTYQNFHPFPYMCSGTVRVRWPSTISALLVQNTLPVPWRKYAARYR